MEFLDKLSSPFVVIGVLALCVFELVKHMDLAKMRKRDMNGGNPVVSAINRLTETTTAEHARTREKLCDCFGALDKRLAEHEIREERKWDSVDFALRDKRA
jgi:hypothetical protein